MSIRVRLVMDDDDDGGGDNFECPSLGPSIFLV